MKRLLLTILFLLLLSTPCWAASYYVDCGAAAGGNGALATPWNEISDLTGIAAGDTIYLANGCTFREMLTIPTAGTDTNTRVTISAYGSGAAPILNGSDNVIGVSGDWADQGGNVWRKNIGTTEPLTVWFNTTTIGTNDATPDAAYEWTYSSPNLDVYATANPATFYTAIEAAQRLYGVYGYRKNFITVQDIAVTKTNSQGVYTLGGSDWIIDRINASYCTQFGVRIDGQDATNDVDNAILRNSTITYCGYGGVSITDYAVGVTVQNNVIHHNCYTPGQTEAGIKVWGDNTTGAIIQNNTVYENKTTSFASQTGMGIWLDTTGGGHTVRANLIHDNSANGIFLEREDALPSTISYNIIYNEAGNAGDSYSGAGIRVSRGTSTGNLVYNNTIYNCKYGLACFGDWPGAAGTVTNNIFKNNIIYGSTTRALTAWTGGENDGTNGSGNVYTYNSFGPEASNFIEWGAGSFVSTYADFATAYGGATNSITTDPQLVSAITGNFKLKGNSPARRAGDDVGLYTDFAGRGVSSTPTIGAYQFYGAPKVMKVGGKLRVFGGGSDGAPAVAAADSFVLLETGDYVLLETGDKIIME